MTPEVLAQFWVRAIFCFHRSALTRVGQDEVVISNVPARLSEEHPLRW